MSEERRPPDRGDKTESGDSGVSRRDFLKTTTAGLVGATVAGAVGMADTALAHDFDERHRGKDAPRGRRILLKGGIVLTLDSDPKNPDLERGDILIEGSKIKAIGPNLHASAHQVIDCKGMILMPGMISTHNHQYEAIQRSVIADGLIIFPDNPAQAEQQTTDTTNNVYEDYRSVVQSIWTSGRIGSAAAPQWDLGRSPYDPEDCYNAELIACLSQLTQGITCGTDTSQSSHTPEHTDAMIEACMASGRRTLFDYSGGIDRGATGGYGVPTSPYEYPGTVLAPGQVTGIERVAKKYFTSKDQLVTLGFAGGPTVINNLPAPYTGMTGWQLGREFGAFINNHNVGGKTVPATALANALAPFDDVTLVHCVRWQDNPVAQIGADHTGYPNPSTSEAMQIWADNGGHVSIAGILEPQMRHGLPPFQMCLNYGIMPSLSPDVDTNMTPDPFSLMRGSFSLSRGYANDLAFNLSDPIWWRRSC